MNKASANDEPTQAFGSKARRSSTRRVHLAGKLVMKLQKSRHSSRMRARSFRIDITRASSMAKIVGVAVSGSRWGLSLCVGEREWGYFSVAVERGESGDTTGTSQQRLTAYFVLHWGTQPYAGSLRSSRINIR